MKFLCICPTYGRPTLALNAIACFQAQVIPSDWSATLVVVDDNAQLPMLPWMDLGGNKNLIVISRSQRFPSLTAKYNHVLHEVLPFLELANLYDAVAVWDDDDVYFPHHLITAGEALKDVPEALAAKPSTVYSLYQSYEPFLEPADGRFHGSVVFRSSHIQTIGGWIATLRIDFDQLMIASCHGKIVDSLAYHPLQPFPSYVYRWGSTNSYHCSGDARAADLKWYERVPVTETKQFSVVEPRLDAETVRLFDFFIKKQNERDFIC